MNRLNYFLLFLVLFIIFSGCKSLTTITIGKNLITRFEINEIYGDEDYIEISGLIGASSYNYKKIDIIKENQTMKILMHGEFSALNKNGSGNFNIVIPVEKNINKIFWSNNDELIWERKSIEILMMREELLKLPKYSNYNDVIQKFGEPDDVTGSGFLIIQYTLNNNRKAILNFSDGKNGLMQLIELYGRWDGVGNQNRVFDFE